MATYRVTEWPDDVTLATAEDIMEAREKAARVLGVTAPVRAAQDTIPSDAIEGWHGSCDENCGSVLIRAGS